ncbi:MAG: Na(+)-translocating NADH-quinone reductase subunit A [Pseudomonadota bacterium]
MQGKTISLTKGLDIPIDGQPRQTIEDAPLVSSVAVLGRDYHGLKPTMAVQQGDRVVGGQVLFTDKRNPGVRFTAPGSGTVSAIHRGARRVLQSVVISLDNEDAKRDFEAVDADNGEAVRALLIDSGLWTGLRTRPYSKVPAVDAVAAAIFVTAIDTRPLAQDPGVVLEKQASEFETGLRALASLAPVVNVCVGSGTGVPSPSVDRVHYHHFDGPHPAGLAGTHIHQLHPVTQQSHVWTVGYQDVLAIGKLVGRGELSFERVVSLAGPMVSEPRLLRTRLGASTDDLVEGQLKDGAKRVLSGSVLDGFNAQGASAWLGRHSQQVVALADGRPRQFMHWVNPLLKGWYSSLPVFFGGGGPNVSFNTSQNGSRRAMVPIGNYERVVPHDVLITQLLRALLVRDTDEAQRLGALDFDEEDLALCTFVCHSKYEYGQALRESLDIIERDG